MSHMIEMINGVAQFAYSGEKPWHNLGKEVPADLTPQQIMEAAGLNWEVRKFPTYAILNEEESEVINTGRSALIRMSDHKLLDVVTDDWNIVQNQEAFEFFNEFVMAGDMSMEVAGSLKGGQIVWGLARIKESFELFKGDRVDNFLLFTNYHKYGNSTTVQLTPIRVVCNNTLTLSLNSYVDNMVRYSHRKVFSEREVKVVLGIATDKINRYKEMAEFLGSKMAPKESIVEYFERLFPTSEKKKESGIMSKNAEKALAILETQPGAEFADGSWWQPYNAATFLVDHDMGRSDESRLQSAWYGTGKTLKNKALELALEMAA